MAKTIMGTVSQVGERPAIRLGIEPMGLFDPVIKLEAGCNEFWLCKEEAELLIPALQEAIRRIP